MMCPAVIFANNRIINTNGRRNTPRISIGVNMIRTAGGTPGIANTCRQYDLFAENEVTKNVITARIPVTARLPVTFAPPGRIGINPSKLLIRMKKKTVNR